MRLRIIGLASLAVTLATSPALALPGQSVAAFKRWIAVHPFVRNVEKKTAEMSGMPYYTVTNADHGIAWEFTANTDGSSVTDESLAVSAAGGKPGSAPIRHDGTGYGFVFFRTLYGPAVAADFKASTPVATFVDKTDPKTVTRFWRGKLYGYSTSTNGAYLSIETLKALATNIAQMRHCTAHPTDCME